MKKRCITKDLVALLVSEKDKDSRYLCVSFKERGSKLSEGVEAECFISDDRSCVIGMPGNGRSGVISPQEAIRVLLSREVSFICLKIETLEDSLNRKLGYYTDKEELIRLLGALFVYDSAPLECFLLYTGGVKSRFKTGKRSLKARFIALTGYFPSKRGVIFIVTRRILGCVVS